MAMTNYPYPASFLEPMPAWPVNESVKPFVDIPTADELASVKSDLLTKFKSLFVKKQQTDSTSEGFTDREKQLLNAV